MNTTPEHTGNPEVLWNSEVKLILADVDQTLADDFMPAEPDMVRELDSLLGEGRSLFFVTGGPLNRLKTRIIDRLSPTLRQNVLVSHCSGAEVWGFDQAGNQRPEPFYSYYDTHLSNTQKLQWRDITNQVIDEFQLVCHPPQPVQPFREEFGTDPFVVMYEDRGPQITFELINGYELTEQQRGIVKGRLPDLEEVEDLREPLVARIAELLGEANIPVTPRLGGVFAVDMALKGVSKTESVATVLGNEEILQTIGISRATLENPAHLEIWGDRFDKNRGTDWLMCKAVDPRVRAIDFRQEDPATFPTGYNISVWPGEHYLQSGALEYIRSRH